MHLVERGNFVSDRFGGDSPRITGNVVALGEAGKYARCDAEMTGLGGREQTELAIRQVTDRTPLHRIDHAAIMAAENRPK